MRSAVEGQGGNRDGLALEVERYARTLEAANLALGRIARDLAADLRRDSGEASTYGVALADFAAELAGRDALAPLASLAEAVRSATEAMHLRLLALEARIARGAAETEELHERLVEAKREAGTDPLTGAANRRRLEEVLAAEATREDGAPFSLLVLDIDRFKGFNDQYGHQVGDQALRLMARLLIEMVKGGDLVARFGGEEFAVVLPETGLAHALALAEKIRARLATQRVRLRRDGRTLEAITISVGVAEYRPGERLEDLVARTDEALYRAKRGGRDRVEAADEPERDEPPRRAALG
jgi:diguanylate cyclase